MKDKVYAQVYSMIRVGREGLLDACKLFSKVGYDGIEVCGDNTEGLTIPDFKKFLQDLNLKVKSIQAAQGLGNIPFAEAMELKYMVEGINNDFVTRDAILKECDAINERAKTYKEHGFIMCLHNHSDEFTAVQDDPSTLIYDMFLKNTDPELVKFQCDVGWVARGGKDPVEYIKANPGRFPMIHVKECCEAAPTDEDKQHFPKRIVSMIKFDDKGLPIFTDEMKNAMYETRSWNKGLGTGIIDWKALVEAADAQGADQYINEREYYHYEGSDGTPECCVKLDYDFLRSL